MTPLLLFVATAHAGVACTDDTLFGEVHSVVDTEGDVAGAAASRLVRIHRKDGNATRIVKARPGTEICLGDLVETWHDVELWIERPGLGTAILEGGALLRVDAEPRILRGPVSFVVDDGLAGREKWAAWAGTAYYHSLQSRIRIDVDDPCSETAVVAIEPGDDHRVLVTVAEGDPVEVRGGSVAAVKSTGVESVQGLRQAEILGALDSSTLTPPMRQWGFVGTGGLIATAGLAGVLATYGSYLTRETIPNNEWRTLQVENTLAWGALAGGTALTIHGLHFRKPERKVD